MVVADEMVEAVESLSHCFIRNIFFFVNETFSLLSYGSIVGVLAFIWQYSGLY